MEPEVYPYGPSPAKLVELASAIVKEADRVITLDRLEELGIHKTQVSIALSGLKQLGFLDSQSRVTSRFRQFADPQQRKKTCLAVLKEGYASLADVAKSNPGAWESSCLAYLARQGKGDSAQRKILKLFQFFLEQSGERVEAERLTPRAVKGPSEDASVQVASLTDAPPIAQDAIIAATGTGQEADPAAVDLANSLIRYCESREAILCEKMAIVQALQAECAQVEQEIQKARAMLEDHLRFYPGLQRLMSAKPRTEK